MQLGWMEESRATISAKAQQRCGEARVCWQAAPDQSISIRMHEDGSFAQEGDSETDSRPIEPVPGQFCTATVTAGDKCDKFVQAYGITDLARLIKMNSNLKCPDMVVGTVVFIRREQGCGSPCRSSSLQKTLPSGLDAGTFIYPESYPLNLMLNRG
ncbi:hypothetical protein BV898_18856 [Hypsibius exemplaris]|uniref:LysM domain-containing protein n=1 Tax=Hypsibius exemplaris TaxID=2072580 RepID=A0A9X6RNE5_HYPEX|nr:hypothetical protein BV898_18856 [Hypsibius exemplaris]